MGCKINIITVKLMKSIGFAPEILEQFKRLLRTMNSIIEVIYRQESSCVNFKKETNNDSNLPNQSYATADFLIEFAFPSYEASTSSQSSFPPLASIAHNKFRILTIYYRVLRKAYRSYLHYGVLNYAEYYLKSCFKCRFNTTDNYIDALCDYVKLHLDIDGKNYGVNLIMNDIDTKRMKKIEAKLEQYVTSMIKYGLFYNTDESKESSLLQSPSQEEMKKHLNEDKFLIRAHEITQAATEALCNCKKLFLKDKTMIKLLLISLKYYGNKSLSQRILETHLKTKTKKSLKMSSMKLSSEYPPALIESLEILLTSTISSSLLLSLAEYCLSVCNQYKLQKFISILFNLFQELIAKSSNSIESQKLFTDFFSELLHIVELHQTEATGESEDDFEEIASLEKAYPIIANVSSTLSSIFNS